MAYTVLLSEQAKTELAVIKKSGDMPTLKKIAKLLVELQEHLFCNLLFLPRLF